MKGKRAKKLLAALLAGTLVLGSVVGVSAWTGASGEGGWWDDGTGYSSSDTLSGDGTWYYVVAVDNLVTTDGDENPSVMFNVELYGDTENDAGTGYITTGLNNDSWIADALTCTDKITLDYSGSVDIYSVSTYVIEIVRDGQDFTITYMDAEGNGLFGWTFTGTNFVEEIYLHTIAQWGQVTSVLTKGTLTVDETATVQINDSWEEDMYYFIPETSGKYTLTSTGCNADAYCELYEIAEDGDLNMLSDDDDSGETDDEDSRYNFALSYWLEAGELYFYNPTANLEYYKSDEAPDSESYTVTLTYSDEEVIDSLAITELVASMVSLDSADCSGTKILVTYKSGNTNEVVIEKKVTVHEEEDYSWTETNYSATDDQSGSEIYIGWWCNFLYDSETGTVERTVSAYAYKRDPWCESETVSSSTTMVPETITLDTDYATTIPVSDSQWYAYTPDEDGTYDFVVTSNDDVNVVLFSVTSDGYLNWTNDSDSEIETVLKADTTYYYCVSAEEDSEVSVSVRLTDTSIYPAEDMDAAELELDTPYSVNVDTDGEGCWFTYTPETSEYYTFCSGDVTAEGSLYPAYYVYYLSDEGKLLLIDAFAGGGNAFYSDFYFEEGVCYYFYVYATDDGEAAGGSYSVTLSRMYVEIELLDQVYTDTVSSASDAHFSFTPVTDGTYYIKSTIDGDCDYNGYNLFYIGGDGNTWYLGGDYDEETGSRIFELQAGVKYYYVVFADTYDYETGTLNYYTVSVMVTQENHEHTYTNAADHITWTWADDYSSAIAVIRCDACAQTVTLTAVITSEETDSSIVYTATVTTSDGTVVTDTQTVETKNADGSSENNESNKEDSKSSEEDPESGEEDPESDDEDPESDDEDADAENTSSGNKKTADAAAAVPVMIALLGCAVIAVSKRKSMS